MSHLSVLVLTTSGDEDEVTRLLAPYDENNEWFADGSRWDWWVIGGRWTGLIAGGNVLAVSDLVKLDPLPTTFALVTPDGKWQEKGRMGWFGMTTDDEDGNGVKAEELWVSAYKAALEQYPDATAVVVDCHV